MKVLINVRYGGFCISEEAFDLYNKKRIENGLKPKENIYGLVRHDILLIEVFEEMGDKINDKHCHIIAEEIDDKYEKFYRLHEYDGSEELIVLYDKYIVHEISKLISDIDNDETINKIKQIIKENS